MKKDYSKFSKDELVKMVEKMKSCKKYGLIWDEEKTKEQFEKESENALPVLKEDKGKEIKTGPAKPTNILIEGDNYHALSVLNYTHQGKIDVIYIDPPYNTGAKDWKYNNDYVDGNDTYRHSKWLSMMNNRLRVAKRLLKEDGVLICAIDDNELNRVWMLLEEIFGDHEIHCITIIHNPRGVQGKNFSYTHEYALFVIPSGKQIIQEKKRKSYSKANLNLRDKGGESLRSDAKNCFYPFYVKGEKIIGIGDVPPQGFNPKKQTTLRKDGVYEVWPVDVRGIQRKWRYARQSVEDILDILRTKKTDSGFEIEIYKEYEKYKTVWSEPEYNGSLYGTKLLHEILPNCDFDFPKSVYLTRECLFSVISKKKQAVVLDYFAGSGTTGHATLMLNNEDGGERVFILCTNNENGIATDVCQPRIEKVIKGYRVNKEKITGLGGNLKYFKTAFVKKSISEDDLKIRITRECTELLCLRERIFDEVKTKPNYRIFKQNGRVMAVYYALERGSLEQLRRDLDNIEGEKLLYCFTLDPLGLDESDFKDWEDIRIEPIPQKILDVYNEISL